MKLAKHDILTLANAVTLSGLIITGFGAARLNTLDGFMLVIFGKLLDVLDGPIARRTHASDLGAALDATADKITGLVILISALYFGLAPTWLIVFLFSQHVAVSVISIYAALGGWVLKVIRLGKNNMFLHLFTLFVMIGGNFTHGGLSQAIRGLGLTLAIASIITGLATTYSYLKTAKGLIK